MEQSASAMTNTTSQVQWVGQWAAAADEQYCICQSEINNAGYTDRCFHVFCFGCIQQWTAMTAVCLLCRRSFDCILCTVRAVTTNSTWLAHSLACRGLRPVVVCTADPHSYATACTPGPTTTGPPSMSLLLGEEGLWEPSEGHGATQLWGTPTPWPNRLQRHVKPAQCMDLSSTTTCYH